MTVAVPPGPRGHVLFSGDDRLEGLLEWPAETEPGGAASRVTGGVVVSHPHPLYGGTMAQPVVYRVARACREHGFVSLRFNFRGVGRSRGRFSGTEEHRDVEAALAFLRGRLAVEPGRRVRLGLAGYSFGSAMAALAAGSGEVPVDALALVAFVVEWEGLPPGTLEALARFRGPVLVVCGAQDDLARPAAVEHALVGLGIDLRLSVVEGAGHLFERRQREVGERVAAFFTENLGGRRTPIEGGAG